MPGTSGRCYALRAVSVLSALIGVSARAQSPASQPTADRAGPLVAASSAATASTSQPAGGTHHALPDSGSRPTQGGFFIWPEPAPLTSPISTDRPGFSDSVDLVPRGHVQLELGYTFTYDHGAVTTRDNTFPQPLLRVGLTDDFEFRLKWAGWSLTEISEPGPGRVRPHGTTVSQNNGGSDMSVGFKQRLTRQKGLLPSLTLIPMLSLPTGGPTKTSGDVNPSVELAYNWGLTDKLSLYGIAVAAVPSDAQGYFYQTQATVAFSYQLTDKLCPYIEYYGAYPAARGADCAHTLDGGFSFRITDNVQIDLSAGVGLNDVAPDFFTSVGLALRL